MYGGLLSGPTVIVDMVDQGSHSTDRAAAGFLARPRLMADLVLIVYKPEPTQLVDFTAPGRSISVWTLGTGLY